MTTAAASVERRGPWARYLRVGWAFFTLLVVESLVFGLSVLPAAGFWQWHLSWGVDPEWLRVVVLAMAFIPAYTFFAITLMALSAIACRLTGWRTPAGVELRISDIEWALLDWARYMISTHIVRIFAGTFFRSTALWTQYHRWNGARMGRGVFINSVSLTDHNLLAFGNRVVIGSNVHLSGHTVEAGLLKTAPVLVGDDVTVGIGSVVGIGAQIGAGAQVGALSVIPKHRALEPGSIYVGGSIKRIDRKTEPVTPDQPASN